MRATYRRAGPAGVAEQKDREEHPANGDAPALLSLVPEGTRREVLREEVVARVVEVRGPCPYGYRLGDTFHFGPDGRVSPPLCHVALNALGPFVARALEGALAPEERACCPVWDHLLVFEFSPGVQRKRQVSAA